MSQTDRLGADSDPAGRALAFVYGFFALAAGARSGYQVATKLGEAPLAILLSCTAAAVYGVAFIQLRRREPRAWRLALAACSLELLGVLVVGTASVTTPEAFPRATVWSAYGAGYGFLPLVLPVAGLAWLLRPTTRTAFGSVRRGSGRLPHAPRRPAG